MSVFCAALFVERIALTKQPRFSICNFFGIQPSITFLFPREFGEI